MKLQRAKARHGSRDNWQGMNWIRKEKRLAIYIRDGRTCVYCSKRLRGIGKLTLDHVRPFERGGTHDAWNLVTSCIPCNTSKGLLSARDFARSSAVLRRIEQRINAEFDVSAAKAILARKTWKQALAA